MRITRVPNPKKISEAQEKMLGQAERMHSRAEIWEKGVAKFLETSIGIEATEEAARVLHDAASMRREAYALQDKATRDSRPKGKR